MSAKDRARLGLATATAAAKDGSDAALCRGELYKVTDEHVRSTDVLSVFVHVY